MELRAAFDNSSDLARCMLFAVSADPRAELFYLPRRSFFIFPAGAFLSSPPEFFYLPRRSFFVFPAGAFLSSPPELFYLPRRSFFIFPAGAFLSSPPELFQWYFTKNLSTGLSFSLVS